MEPFALTAYGVPRDADAVGADAFALNYVRDRLVQALSGADLDRVNEELGKIQIAIVDLSDETLQQRDDAVVGGLRCHVRSTSFP